MKRSRTWAAVLTAVLVLALMASGCAKPAAPADSPADQPATKATPAAADDKPDAEPSQAASGEKVKIKLYTLPQDDAADSDKQLFEFEKAALLEHFPDYDIEFTRMAPGTDYRQQYDKLLMSGDGPTLWASLPFVDIQTRMRNGTIADITEYVDNWQLMKDGLVNPSILDALHDNEGRWYAVPFAPYTMGMLYNRAAIEAGGGDVNKVPATWDEFGEYAAQLTDRDVPRFGYLLLGSDFCAWPFTPWVWSAGGEMVRPNGDGTYKIAFNEPEGVDAMMYMHDLVFKYKCTQTDLLQSYDDYMTNMKMGYGCYGWGMPDSMQPDELAKYDQKQETYGVIPIPGKAEGQAVAFAGGETWTMHPKATKEQMDACWEILNLISYNEEYLRSRWEYENELGRLNPKPSCRVDLIEAKYEYATSWPEHWKTEFTALANNARPEPFCAEWNSLKDYIVKPTQQILADENITREQVQALLDECAEKLYTDFPEAFKKPAE